MSLRAALPVLAAVLLAACGNGQSPYEPQAAQARVKGVLPISATALATRMAAGERFQLIDVRTPGEFADGHIAGAVNIPVETFDPATLPDAKGRARILYCRTGKRSGMLAQHLAEHSGDTANFMEGGLQAWERAGQPLVR